jgi:hypothetical protein
MTAWVIAAIVLFHTGHATHFPLPFTVPSFKCETSLNAESVLFGVISGNVSAISTATQGVTNLEGMAAVMPLVGLAIPRPSGSLRRSTAHFCVFIGLFGFWRVCIRIITADVFPFSVAI